MDLNYVKVGNNIEFFTLTLGGIIGRYLGSTLLYDWHKLPTKVAITRRSLKNNTT